jgi:O-antigen ligase
LDTLAPLTLPTPASAAGSESVERKVTTGALLLAAAIPLLFLHEMYQPKLGLPLGGTSVDFALSDAAIAVVVTATLLRLRREGLGILRPAAVPLAAAAAFLAVVLAWSFLPLLRGQDYSLATTFVSGAKFCWYALLAPAVIVLVTCRRDGIVVLRTLVVWSLAATGWGALQFLGVVSEFEGKRPGQREPSFLGIHDLSALSGAALALGFVGVALRGEPLGRRWSLVAVVGGAIGLVLSGAVAGVIGVCLAAAATLAVAARDRKLTGAAAATVVAVLVLVTAGTSAMRATALERFAEFLGIRAHTQQEGGVQSYAHRTLLGYIGVRIFLDHPITGVGWQASALDFAYTPYLEAARRRFPSEPDQAFPSPEHRWGVQNAYIETLADLGIVGLLALLVAFGTALVRGVRRSRVTPFALVGVAWILVAAGVWLGLGLVAGIPLAALTWLGFGLTCSRA